MQFLMGFMLFISIFMFILALMFLLINIFKKKPIRTELNLMATCFIVFVFSLSVGNALYTPEQKAQFAEARIFAENIEPSENSTFKKQKPNNEHSSTKYDKPEIEPPNGDGITEIERTELPIINTGFSSDFILMGFTIDEATALQSLFLQIGINSISDAKAAVGTGIDELQSFVATANEKPEQKFFFTIEKRSLYFAGFLDEDLYDSTKGGVLKSIGDVHIPKTDVSIEIFDKLKDLSIEAIGLHLTRPQTANYLYSSWAVGRSDDKYKVVGSLKSKNGFGDKNEIQFGVWFTDTNGTFFVDGITLDGARVE